jgi:hypothetical protein
VVGLIIVGMVIVALLVLLAFAYWKPGPEQGKPGTSPDVGREEQW